MIRSLREEPLIDQLDCQTGEGRNDFVCLSASSEGDRLNELFGNCMPRLFRVADSVLHNSHDSEDALQDGLVSALRHIDQFKGNAQFSTWLYSIVRNSSLARLRKQRAHPIVSVEDQRQDEDKRQFGPDVWIDSGADPERACAQAELSSLFAQTLEGLPANYQAIIRLCDFEGFSGKEAAERLGLSVSALKAQHHRARQAIRESMGIYFEK